MLTAMSSSTIKIPPMKSPTNRSTQRVRSLNNLHTSHSQKWSLPGASTPSQMKNYESSLPTPKAWWQSWTHCMPSWTSRSWTKNFMRMISPTANTLSACRILSKWMIWRPVVKLNLALWSSTPWVGKTPRANSRYKEDTTSSLHWISSWTSAGLGVMCLRSLKSRC